jgi:hypothetical protein
MEGWLTMSTKDKTRRWWREAILAQRKSGLNISAFCEQRKLCRPSFFVRRKQLGLMKETAQEGKSKGFRRIQPPIPMGPTAELRAVIETPNGYRVHAGLIGAEELKSVLDVIKCL